MALQKENFSRENLRKLKGPHGKQPL